MSRTIELAPIELAPIVMDTSFADRSPTHIDGRGRPIDPDRLPASFTDSITRGPSYRPRLGPSARFARRWLAGFTAAALGLA